MDKSRGSAEEELMQSVEDTIVENAEVGVSFENKLLMITNFLQLDL